MIIGSGDSSNNNNNNSSSNNNSSNNSRKIQVQVIVKSKATKPKPRQVTGYKIAKTRNR